MNAPAIVAGSLLCLGLSATSPLSAQTVEVAAGVTPSVIESITSDRATAVRVSAPSPLSALEVDALVSRGRIAKARRAARASANLSSDAALLSRAADFEDRYGADSSRYYKSLVAAQRSAGEPDTVWRAAAERGMLVSIRERQTVNCEWFAALLNSKLCAPDGLAQAQTVLVPGGLRALLSIAGGPRRDSGKASMADFSRTLTARQTGLDPWAAESYRARLIEYFRLLSELKSMGESAPDKTLLRLSLKDSSSRTLTEHALDLLGWRLRSENGKAVMELATETSRPIHHDIASALGIDVLAMKERLQSGADFVVEIQDEKATVFPSTIFPGEEMWQRQFYPSLRYNGGFAEAMVRDPAVALFYSVLSDMEPRAA